MAGGRKSKKAHRDGTLQSVRGAETGGKKKPSEGRIKSGSLQSIRGASAKKKASKSKRIIRGEVIEEIKALTPDEQRKVKDLIDSLLKNSDEAVDLMSPEDLFERRLLEAGVISEIPKRDPASTQYEDFKPIEIKGKPLSEIIIEERR